MCVQRAGGTREALAGSWQGRTGVCVPSTYETLKVWLTHKTALQSSNNVRLEREKKTVREQQAAARMYRETGSLFRGSVRGGLYSARERSAIPV